MQSRRNRPFKLTKKQESEVLKVYHAYWDGYLTGDVKNMASILADGYTQVGSAEREVFYNKKDAVQFLRETIDQVAGKARIKNQSIKIEVLSEGVLIRDLFDIYVLTDGKWVYYDKLRASTLMKEIKGSWKFIHQHSSVADMRTQDGENIATDKIAAENIQLKDAIKRRTIELEQKNRELEIETALEKVRSRSLSMHQSEELSDVGNTVLHQLKLLGIRAETSWLWFIDLEHDEIEIWTTHKNKLAQSVKVKASDYATFKRELKAWKKQEPFLKLTIPNKEAIRSIKEIFGVKITKAKGSSHFHLLQSRHRYGFLGLGTWKEATDEEVKTCIRFAKVFEQAYTRFLDLQKAEAQAREAEIEVALERIRTRALAMHTSSELMEVADVLREQMGLLGQPELEASVIHIYPQKSETFESWYAMRPAGKRKGKIIKGVAHYRIKSSSVAREMIKAYNKSATEYTLQFRGAKLKEWINEVLEQAPDVGKSINKNTPNQHSYHFSNFSGGSLMLVSLDEPSEEAKELQCRAAIVFGFAYRRFLDLQKAEAQAREAQIELALERTRTQSMIMQHSKELDDTLRVFHGQVLLLGINSAFSYLWLPDEENEKHKFWATWAEQQNSSTIFKSKALNYPLDRNEPATAKCLVDWKSDEPVHSYALPPGEVENYFANWAELLDGVEKLKPEHFPGGLYYVEAYMKYGCFGVMIESELTEDEKKILGRFAIEFERAYTRFLDLQKAEAQAREAKIEAALEKVRSRSLAMHKAEELIEVASVLRTEMGLLGVEELETSSIYILNDENATTECWYAIKDIRETNGKLVTDHMTLNLKETWVGRAMISFYHSGEKQNSILMQGENRKEWINYCATKSTLLQGYYGGEIPERTYHLLKFSNGYMGAASPGSISTESWNLLQRATSVFSFAYTRFLDLQKAEAQTREAQIEAALEKLRSKTMAMQRSEQLPETAELLFQQFALLGGIPDRIGIGIVQEDTEGIEWWITDQLGSRVTRNFFSSAKQQAVAKMFEAWQQKKESLMVDLTGSELDEWIRFVKDDVKMPIDASHMKGRRVQHAAFFSQGLLLCSANDLLPQATFSLLVRFAKVFEQTYTRFLDLQKAEAQAREATIEAALERVRGKAMAMHNSNDLLETAGMVFTELRKLGIKPMRAGVGLQNKENRNVLLYSATSSNEGDSLSMVGSALLDDHPVLTNIHDTWLRGEDYFFVMSGDVLKTYYEKVTNNFNVPNQAKAGLEHHGYFLSFSEGSFYGYYEQPISEDQIKTLHRFKAIIDLTFRRYLELQKAESIAKDAIRQASLDRVRAEIASMRTTEDLDRITPLVWSELTTLGIPFVRCGIFIMDEGNEMIHNYLSTPDGKSISAFDLPYDSPGFFAEALAHWKKKETYIDHMDKKRFDEIATTLVQQGIYASKDQYISTLSHSDLHAHFLPFLQGSLYVANTSPLDEANVHLVQSVADAFSTAYARYEDFNRLESAKKQVENTLTDLKLAQTQLIQSEKMASLGELTAGIAHEIQNPLNFVNNFSEVSNELITEMNEEIEKGNLEEARALAIDIKQNLEKILHHGKRADGIVKGMLQHSRSGSSQKELTDINVLADEYLRLAYHGLRAKDKSFNAKFETDFDPSLKKLNVAPQDIGRVILNLITNAFYIVNERSKNTKEGYQPTVWVSTQMNGDKVLISVKDNGTGMSEAVKEKIFQPFFTTKPTGQGTGLGLSLSYDIVKAHGGELKVESKHVEGLPAEASAEAGSEFVIQLPIV